MGRYWSLEECCWVDYSSPAQPSDVVAEAEAVGGDQIPEQGAPAQREPAFR